MTKKIAWGCSKLLDFYIQNNPDHGISHIIDSSPEKQGKVWGGGLT